MQHNCDNCENYNWYFDYCYKWDCEVDGREVHDCYEPHEVYETIKRGLEDAINGRVTEHSVSVWTDAPIVEYAPVVRCRDCKRFAEFTSNGKTMGFGSCNNPQNIMSKCPRTDWFCADGERRRE